MIYFPQIPPAPPKPDFDVSREKLQKLGEGNKSSFACYSLQWVYCHLKDHSVLVPTVFNNNQSNDKVFQITHCNKLILGWLERAVIFCSNIYNW